MHCYLAEPGTSSRGTRQQSRVREFKQICACKHGFLILPVMWPLLECWRCFTGLFGMLYLLVLTEVYMCGSGTCEI
ncbi:hypothetical protein PVAP13_7KG146000 [Panicum virgatum]|uniref:Uncharacterized protein n=1 Tax=Panicum virgatum TaxID=38727 RepID=A0A8T0QHL3_PANVG|nr:hypothetical protein PVAP13_7KG146000 [Panicum virgatum]KAG2572041.1 hypothetical protein PVAP13_7KG146000 [Panicum virgatum]KAG2572042.1 hypothetical protein PVAP13_7KG146000 [Panicum virgatum]